MDKINAYFVKNHKLTLALTWIFTAIAVGIGATIALFFADMSYFLFLAWIAVPVILGIYFRLMYGRYQEAERKRKAAEKEAASQSRYGHSKKKKR